MPPLILVAPYRKIITSNPLDGAGVIYGTDHAIWNPEKTSALMTVSEDRLSVLTCSDWSSAISTKGKSSGKWYWEFSNLNGGNAIIGLARLGQENLNIHAGGWPYSVGFNWGNNVMPNWPSLVTASLPPTAPDADFVLGMALDMDAGALFISYNGVWQLGANPFNVSNGTTGKLISSITSTVYPVISGTAGTSGRSTVNFGATPFKYGVPTGYHAGVF